MRIPLLAALGVAILGIVLGSFFDLSISTAIASPNSGLGLTLSAIGPTIGFAAIAAMGGGFIVYGLRKEYHIVLRVFFFIMAVGCLGVSIYYPAGEYFGINGFYGAAPEWVGYFIVIVPESAAMVGGYFLFKNCQNKNMWIVFCIAAAVLGITLVAALPILKGIMHRPRYRLVSTTDVPFHDWWKACTNHKEWLGITLTDPDNFKSFPSGHTAEACIPLVAVVFLPLADKKFEKIQLPLFLGACGLVLVVAFARILAAAHYLSDVSMGATIMLVLLVIANEVVMRVKALHPEEAIAVPEEK